ncbi:putative structural protein [Staphylococcus phage vB_SauH_DELF3]|nr:putative structural protein [Staphylococcus phage vB_SauH_DELF3]
MSHYDPLPHPAKRFLDALELDMWYTHKNLFDEEAPGVSKLYNPQPKLSEFCRINFKDIKSNYIPHLERTFNNNTIWNKVEQTGIKLQSDRIYLMVKDLVMEAYHIEQGFLTRPEFLKYLTEEDVFIEEVMVTT